MAIDRRSLLRTGLGVFGSTLAAGCQAGTNTTYAPSQSPTAQLVQPDGPQVNEVDKKRKRNGTTYDFPISATVGPVDLGGPTVTAWSYQGRVPGREMRFKPGDTVRARVSNGLPQTTTVHWHGLDIRNNMDGVPEVTQSPIPRNGSFTYEYVAERPGTYYYHPHDGLQFAHGLYGPLIIDDPREPLSYDSEWVIVLDDWLEGIDGLTPEKVYSALKQGGRTGASSPPSPADQAILPRGYQSKLLGGDPGDVRYPYYLINGRVPSAPVTFTSKPGRRIRLRIINAGADTAFLVALGGHKMTITHTDGYPIKHVEADSVLLGMGERYDALVTLQDGVFPLVAVAEGKRGSAFAVVRTGTGSTPPASARPTELSGKVVGGINTSKLEAAPDVRIGSEKIDQTIPIRLTGEMSSYVWQLDNRSYNPKIPLSVLTSGQRVRISYTNNTRMWHPMHFHGHSFSIGGPNGPRKDTVMVLPGQTVNCDFNTNNPGRWVTHCHNAYHEVAGMIGVLAYRA
ncbi:multicopper oxidase family protein [Streptomyces sp. 1222.5]|uniref:multicopper oxidase family protein n=1 Tax=Streptomyces sp. 1222.5 TaxID=1881026 RepID=UPI003EC0EA89